MPCSRARACDVLVRVEREHARDAAVAASAPRCRSRPRRGRAGRPTASSSRTADLAAGGDRGRERDDRGAVDVVVHDRLRQRLDQRAPRSRSTRAPRCPRGGCRRSVGAIRITVSTNASGRCASIRIGIALEAGELLVEDRLALHHRHRRDRADVAEARARACRSCRSRRCGRSSCSAPASAGPRRSPGRRARRPACRRRACPARCGPGARGSIVSLPPSWRDERAVVVPEHAGRPSSALSAVGELPRRAPLSRTSTVISRMRRVAAEVDGRRRRRSARWSAIAPPPRELTRPVRDLDPVGDSPATSVVPQLLVPDRIAALRREIEHIP